MPLEESNNIAVLIDAENVDPAYAAHIMSYAHSLGNVCIREIYGAGISLNEWADPILTYSIHTNFTLRPNRYKNSSDICLVIGAMEILSATREGRKGAVAAIVIASSDSDFSALAVHLRSAGIDVIGMGEAGRCNPMWPRACTDFVPLEAKTPLMRKRDDTPVPYPVPVQERKPAPVPVQPVEKQETRPTVQPTARPVNAVAEPVTEKPAVAAPPAQPSGKQANPANTEKMTAAQPAGKQENPPTAEKTAAAQPTGKKGKQESAEKTAPAQPAGKKKNPVSAEKPAAKTEKKQKKAETDKEPKARNAVRVAPTHKARMEIIRGLIEKEIESHGGRIRSGELFRTIGSNPEYKYDQQRSRRVPMDYLKKQYGMWFGFEPQENGESLVTLKNAAQPGQTGEPAAETTAAGTKEEKTVEQPEPLSAFARQLYEAGIPLGDVARVEETLAGCKNMRDSYNHLRKAFGNETGKKYQQSIKDAEIQIGQQTA